MDNENDKKNKIYIKNYDQKKKELEDYNNYMKNNRVNKTDKKYAKNQNTKNNKRIIILTIIIITITLIAIFLFKYFANIRFNKKLQELNYTKEDIKAHKEEMKELRYLKEDERARKYLNNFITNIKENKFGDEYFKMYFEFKNIFFPTLNDFEIYIKDNFPKNPAVKINNFETIGDLFILFVDIVDKDDFSKSLKDMKFVFKEEELNKYVFSFSVKTQNEKDKEYITPPDEMDFSEEQNLIENEESPALDLLDKMREESYMEDEENKEVEEEKGDED